MATGSPRKRQWRRLQFTVPLLVTIEKRRLVSVIRSRSSQVNAGGLCFFADADLFSEADLAVGDRAEITLTGYDLTLSGVVRNRVGDRCGVQFLGRGTEQAKHLGVFRHMLTQKIGRLHA